MHMAGSARRLGISLDANTTSRSCRLEAKPRFEQTLPLSTSCGCGYYSYYRLRRPAAPGLQKKNAGYMSKIASAKSSRNVFAKFSLIHVPGRARSRKESPVSSPS